MVDAGDKPEMTTERPVKPRSRRQWWVFGVGLAIIAGYEILGVYQHRAPADPFRDWANVVIENRSGGSITELRLTLVDAAGRHEEVELGAEFWSAAFRSGRVFGRKDSPLTLAELHYTIKGKPPRQHAGRSTARPGQSLWIVIGPDAASEEVRGSEL